VPDALERSRGDRLDSTTTSTGLTVKATLDTNEYPAALKVAPSEMASLNIRPAHFHGEWNYTLLPGRR
jgi:hypothetical protein